MKWGMQWQGFGAIEEVKAEADLGLIWASHAQAQALIQQVADRSQADAKALVERLEVLTGQANAWAAQRSSNISDVDWDLERDRLLVEFDQLQVDAAVTLDEQHKKTQFRGALIGAAVVAVGAGGLIWALRKRKKR